MGLFSRQPKRSVPDPVKPPQHGTKNMSRDDRADSLQTFRSTILSVTAVILFLGVAVYAMYGPWFSVRTVTVTGTREVSAASVKAAAEHYLDEWRYGFLPNKNLWLLSRRYLAEKLETRIRERISIEEVRIHKKNRHDLEIVVVERTPVAVWVSGDSRGTVDRTGVLISVEVGETVLPKIVDSGIRPFSSGQQVLTEPVMNGWKILNDAFAASTLVVEEYRIPVPTCPTKIITPEEQEQAITNSAIESQTNSQRNQNSSEPVEILNKNTAIPLNGNLNGNENINAVKPLVVQTECDIAALSKASQEIHVKLQDGPLVLFDRHQDLALAVRTVQRLVSEKSNAGATYIDIRFQERVYIK